jgi:Mce-associated membrane protein
MPIARRLRRLSRRPGRRNRQESEVEADQVSSEVTTEDSSESQGGTDETSTGVTTEDSSESDGGTDETSTEVTAAGSAESEGEADQISADEAAEDSEESDADAEAAVDAGAAGDQRRGSRVGRGWLAGIAAVLVLAAGGIVAGGLLALHYHHESQTIARNDAAALKAAIDCVSATQAPDTNAMIASEQKIIDCGTDAFRSQALLYTTMLVQAYQASNIHVQVSDVRAAVERNNKDGSVDVLVAMRIKVSSDKSENETGYRLRVKMATADGQYKISKLDQVTK